MEPLVSVGIPTYNRPESLKRTLNCIIAQEYQNLEIIISDNCSPNAQVELVIAEYLSDERITYYRQPVNKGALFNFNFILEKAKGDYFMRLADDDWIDTNYIQCCVNFLMDNSDYVSVYGRTALFQPNNEFLKYDPYLSLDQASYSERIEHYYQTVTQNGAYYGVVRKEFANRLIVKKRLADDWLAIAKLAFDGKIKMLETTNLNISLGGIGSSIESIVLAAKLSKFNKYFPWFSIGLNASSDILWGSEVYRKLSFSKRLSLSKICFKTIYRRFCVYNEIRNKYKSYFKAILLRDRKTV